MKALLARNIFSVAVHMVVIGYSSNVQGGAGMDVRAPLIAEVTSTRIGSFKNNDSLVVPKLNFDSNRELISTPSASSSKHDFDFFVGKWKLRNRVLKMKPDSSSEWKEFESTQEMRIVLKGFGNVDNFLADYDGKPFEGMTVRLFNPQTRLWSIYWADSNFGILGLPPVVGSFENKVGHFFSKDVVNGKHIITVYRWDARVADHPIWSQAYPKTMGILGNGIGICICPKSNKYL